MSPAQFIPPPLRLDRNGPPDSGSWILARDFTFYSAELRRAIKVPAGFETDLASVPRLPFMYLLCGATADEAAVVHDYLYTTREVTRAQADAVFAEAIGAIHRAQDEAAKAAGVATWKRGMRTGVGRVQRAMMWLGVRVGGGSRWKAKDDSAGETVIPQDPAGA